VRQQYDNKTAQVRGFIEFLRLDWTALDGSLVPLTGIELVTFALRMRCSTN
jgi:hypothetical protein